MYQFSEHEQTILKILGRRKMSIEELSKTFYDDGVNIGLIERNYVAGVVRRIKEKCEREKLSWTIKGEGVGRKGRIIWKDKRGRTTKRAH